MKLRSWRYFYPAQPRRLWEDSQLLEEICSGDDYVAEIKKNGWQWNLVRFPDGRYEAWTRHGTRSTLKVDSYVKELNTLPWKGLCEVQIEVLDRRTTDVKHKLFFFDVKIWDGELLKGETFTERRRILEGMFDRIPGKYNWFTLGHQKAGTLQLSMIFDSQVGFRDLFKANCNDPMSEGLVFKKRDGRLEVSPSGEMDSVCMFKWKRVEEHMKTGGGGVANG